MKTNQTWQDALAALKPQIKTLPKVEVRRKVSLRSDDFRYEVRYIEPRWDRVSAGTGSKTSHSMNF